MVMGEPVDWHRGYSGYKPWSSLWLLDGLKYSRRQVSVYLYSQYLAFQIHNMAYTYHVDFSHKHLTGVRNMTLKNNASAKKNIKATRKCYEFSAAADVHKSRDSPEIVPVGQVKSLTAPWLYGPACSLATKGVIYPCSRYTCCIPCPCGLCKKVPQTCQASESCYCEEFRGKFQDHKNFHQAFHQLCEFCCQLVKCFPALNLSYWGAMDVEDTDASFASLAIEAVKGEKVYTHSDH